METVRPFQLRKRMTNLAESLARRLDAQDKPVLSNYEIFAILTRIYKDGDARYLRGDKPNHDIFRRTRALLVAEGIIRSDNDYHPLYRVISKSDAAAEDIACSVDPYCYISHMSAMQRYGLTNRRPEALFLTEPTAALKRQLVKTEAPSGNIQFDNDLDRFNGPAERPTAVRHPGSVRGRRLEILSTKHVGEQVAIKGTLARIATIGQTFLDMLDEPARCGGMAHILEIWSEHVRTYLDDVLTTIDGAPKPILKVRAGYILEERLGVTDSRVAAWSALAQRGSSRVLVAGEPFASEFSEKWMLSLNV